MRQLDSPILKNIINSKKLNTTKINVNELFAASEVLENAIPNFFEQINETNYKQVSVIYALQGQCVEESGIDSSAAQFFLNAFTANPLMIELVDQIYPHRNELSITCIFLSA